ncbi:MAG: hypothetical protein ACREHE_05315 [Rhizomicrobium sp.]
MRTIASLPDVWQAHLLRGRLWSEDIPAFVAFQYHVGNNWLAVVALGGAKVQVPNGLEDEARAVIAHADAGRYLEELEAELGAIPVIACPNCGSRRYLKVRPWPASTVALLVAWLTLVAIPPKDRPLRCARCGTIFDPGPDL